MASSSCSWLKSAGGAEQPAEAGAAQAQAQREREREREEQVVLQVPAACDGEEGQELGAPMHKPSRGKLTPSHSSLVADVFTRQGVRFDRGRTFFWIKTQSRKLTFHLYCLCFLFLNCVYSVALMALESDAERDRNVAFKQVMDRVRSQLDNETMELLTPYLAMDPVAGTERWTRFQEADQTWGSWTWDGFFTSFYFTFTTVTTIGYGDVYPSTPGGRLLAVLMIFTMVPLTVVTYTHMADLLSHWLMKRVLRRSFVFQQVLAKYDADKSGSLDRAELGSALEELGVKASADEVDAFMGVFDKNGDGMIDIGEFVSIANKLQVPVGKLARATVRVRFTLLLFVAYLALFAVVSAYALDIASVDALYFSVVTLSTTGYGDINARTAMWLILPIWLGLGLLAILIGAVVDYVNVSVHSSPVECTDEQHVKQVVDELHKSHRQRHASFSWLPGRQLAREPSARASSASTASNFSDAGDAAAAPAAAAPAAAAPAAAIAQV